MTPIVRRLYQKERPPVNMWRVPPTGSLDLIGKGDHGKRLSHATEILANPEKAYKKQIAYFTPDYRSIWIAENPAEQWIARNVEYATKEKERLNAIAYLQ